MPSNAVLYRKRNGQVLELVKARPDGTMPDLTKAASAYFGVAFDVSLPDGDKLQDDSKKVLGPRNELGFAKVYDPATNTVRNATQAEIDGFASAETADSEAEHTARAKHLLKNDPQWRRFAVGLIKLVNKTRVDAGLTPMSKSEIASFIDANVTESD